MSRPSVALLLLGALLACVTAACGAASPTSPTTAVGTGTPPCVRNAAIACSQIDGYPVGSLDRDCGADGAACGEDAVLARLALDAREPGHPSPVSVLEFEPDMARICGSEICAFSSPQAIVVFTFADGTRKATGYQCVGVDPCVGTRTWDGWDDAISMPSP